MEIEETKKNKKKVVLINSIAIIVLALIIGISYAFWQKTKIQEDKNVIATSCFDIELVGENPIDLASVYPISNEEGMETTPYTFTITNTCSNPTHYDVSLEALSNTTFQSSSIRVALEDETQLFSDYKKSSLYFEDSKEARFLTSGVLNKGDGKTFNLRLWLDKEAPVTEQNKVFASKIIIYANLESSSKKQDLSILELGDYISMTPTSTSYTPSPEDTGCLNDENCTQNTINPSELNLWRVIRRNEDGTVDVVSEYVSSTSVYFRGENGYLNFVGGLNTIAEQYTNEKYVSKTRHMGYSNQIKQCTDLSEMGCPTDAEYEIDVNLVQEALGTFTAKTINQDISNYWIASRRSDIQGTDISYRGRLMGDDGSGKMIVGFYDIYVVDKDDVGYNRGQANPVRPILTLKSDVKIESGDGQSVDTAYQLS